MDYLTGSFAPLILLSPVLIALAVAIFFTYRLSARIAQRNAEEEQNRPRLKTLTDDERETALRLTADELEVIRRVVQGDPDALNELDEKQKAKMRSVLQKAGAYDQTSRLRHETGVESPDVESHGKSA